MRNMNDKKILKLIEKHKESKNIFKKTESKVSSPMQSQMVKFVQLSLSANKDILPGFSRFKPEDLK